MYPDIDRNPFDGWPQETIPVEVIIGYILQVDGMYDWLIGQEVTNPHPLADKGVSYNALDAFIAILGGESGFRQYVKSEGEEHSYGIAQINKAAHWRAMGDHIAGRFPNKGYTSMTFRVPVDQMSKSEYADFLRGVSDIKWQMEHAFALMKNRSNDKNAIGGIFADWRAWVPMTKNEDGEWRMYTTKKPDFLQHIEGVQAEVNSVKVYQNWEGKSIDSANSHYEKTNPYTSERYSNWFSPQYLASYGTQEGLGGLEGPGRDTDVVFPDEFGEDAPRVEIGGKGTSDYEKWNIVKKYFLGDLYDLDSDTMLDGYIGSSGFEDWLDEATGDLQYNSDGTVNEEFDKERPFHDMDKKDLDYWQDAYQKATRNEGWINPWDWRAQKLEPTYVRSLAQQVYEIFILSAQSAGVHDPSMTVAAYLGLTGMDEMEQTIGHILDSGVRQRREYTPIEIIDMTLARMSSYKRNGQWHEWEYPIPDYKAEKAAEVHTEIEYIDNFVRPILLGYYPKIVDDIRVGWKNFKIANPNSPASFQNYALGILKNTKRYKTIYGRKPNAFSEAQYLAMFTNPITQAGVTAGEEFDKAVSTSAQMGASQSSAYNIGTYGTGPKTTMGDTFTSRVSGALDKFGTLLGGDE